MMQNVDSIDDQCKLGFTRLAGTELFLLDGFRAIVGGAPRHDPCGGHLANQAATRPPPRAHPSVRRR